MMRLLPWFQSTNRSRDDMDMERILRPRTNAPDVIKSALDKKDMKINSTTIDNLFGVPEKIVIPERYIPDTVKPLSWWLSICLQ